MGYWKDTYGQRSEEFIEGVVAALTAYAWWKDGVQYVGQQRPDGTGGHKLHELIDEAEKELR